MAQYDIDDAKKVKQIMQDTAAMAVKYPILKAQLDSISNECKSVLEFMVEMLNKES